VPEPVRRNEHAGPLGRHFGLVAPKRVACRTRPGRWRRREHVEDGECVAHPFVARAECLLPRRLAAAGFAPDHEDATASFYDRASRSSQLTIRSVIVPSGSPGHTRFTFLPSRADARNAGGSLAG